MICKDMSSLQTNATSNYECNTIELYDQHEMFHVPWQERSPCYLLDPGSMVMELLPLQWSTLSTSEIPLDAPIPAWAGHVPGQEDWLERVVCEGGTGRHRCGAE